MGELSIWHWLVVLIVVMLLFGSGKVSTLMGDVAKGVKAFRKTMAEDERPAPAEAAQASTAGASTEAPTQAEASLAVESRGGGFETEAQAEKTPAHHEG